jgi:hypothetical protein
MARSASVRGKRRNERTVGRRLTNRAFCRHVITSSGKPLEVVAVAGSSVGAMMPRTRGALGCQKSTRRLVALREVLEMVQPNGVGKCEGYVSLARAEVEMVMQPPSVQTQPCRWAGSCIPDTLGPCPQLTGTRMTTTSTTRPTSTPTAAATAEAPQWPHPLRSRPRPTLCRPPRATASTSTSTPCLPPPKTAHYRPRSKQ